MSLYRKYRPNNFSDVIGQDHITTTITNQLKTGTLSHAYLFCGTRGTGKTTVARLLARAINCKSNERPCNSCENCVSILKNNSPNVIEIDAASNNGVDNIRDILEEVKYPPVTGKYKIYIIDEVHMLSIGAFNALLKTLEEPPNHVVFMLATTDPHKVPATIHSRCQRYEFRRIATKQLAENIQKILEEEKAVLEPDAVWLIASLGDGSARDSLSILGQTLAFYGGQTITANNVRDMIGIVDTSVLFDMTWAIFDHDSLGAIEIIHNIGQAGRDFSQFAVELLSHMRNLSLAKLIHEPREILDLEQSVFDKLLEQSKSISQTMLQSYIDQLSDLLHKIKTEKNPKILLEVSIIKLCNIGVYVDDVVEKYVPVTVKKTVPTIERKTDINQSNDTKTYQQENNDLGNFDSKKFISEQSILLKTILMSCKFEKEYDNIYIQAEESNLNLLTPKKEELEKSLKQLFGDNLSLIIGGKKNFEQVSKIEPIEPIEPIEGLTKEQQLDLQKKINFNIEFK